MWIGFYNIPNSRMTRNMMNQVCRDRSEVSYDRDFISREMGMATIVKNIGNYGEDSVVGLDLLLHMISYPLGIEKDKIADLLVGKKIDIGYK